MTAGRRVDSRREVAGSRGRGVDSLRLHGGRFTCDLKTNAPPSGRGFAFSEVDLATPRPRDPATLLSPDPATLP